MSDSTRSTPYFNDLTGVWHYHSEDGGGSSPSIVAADITTDAGTFVASHVFDLGHATTAYFKATLTALAPDGETFGGGSGDIGVGLNSMGVSRDGVAFVNPAGQTIVNDYDDGSGFMVTVGDSESQMTPVPRYIRVGVAVVEIDTSDTYAGANNPTATAHLLVEYL